MKLLLENWQNFLKENVDPYGATKIQKQKAENEDPG